MHSFLRLKEEMLRGTYKCLACVSRSSPGEPPEETGMGPESWLSAKSII